MPLFIENQDKIIPKDTDESINHYSTPSDCIWYDNRYTKCHYV